MSDLIDYAQADVGLVPYSLGAPVEAMDYRASLRRADCSGAMKVWVKRAYGIEIPRTADRQFQATETYRLPSLDPAKLPRNALLFCGGWGGTLNPPGYKGIQHVAAAVGDGVHLVQEGPGNVNVATIASYGKSLLFATAPFGGIMREFDIIDTIPRTIGVTGGDPRIAAAPIDGSANLAGISGMAFASPAKVKLRIPVNATPDSQVGYLAFHKGRLVAVLARNVASATAAPLAATPIPFSVQVPVRGVVDPDGTVHLA